MSRVVQLTDAPGSGRLRGHLMSELPGTAALVCILDGTALAAHAKEAAQLLYDTLTHEAIERSPPPLLVAVNKSDAAGAAAPAMARKLLEAEVARVRLARTTMQDTSERTRALRGIAAGDPDEPFSFDQVRRFAAGSSARAVEADGAAGGAWWVARVAVCTSAPAVCRVACEGAHRRRTTSAARRLSHVARLPPPASSMHTLSHLTPRGHASLDSSIRPWISSRAPRPSPTWRSSSSL